MKIVAIHIFSKITVSVTVTNVFILLAEFLSKILIPKIVIIFRRKVKRSHRYQNKIEEINKKCNLDIKPEVYYKLRLDLEKIDKKLNKINDTNKRKRLINITYLIKRILGEYDKSEADKKTTQTFC